MITLSYALRAKERKHYTDEDIDDDEIEGKRNFDVLDKLKSETYKGDFVKTLTGPEFTLSYVQKTGLANPIIIFDKKGLGMRIPSSTFQVSDVKQCVGSRRQLDVMDVNTQKGLEMSMKEWVNYYETKDRDRLLNVISLEFSHTRLETYVDSPTVVRQLDWVDCVWPRHLKDIHTEATNIIEKMKYPKVQKYCLMSVAGCFTDFHIDFGGTSVWYHILHGEKVFWLIPPTPENMATYENWILSGKQGDMFLADMVPSCQRIRLEEGSTFIIPSGWIHAVYTPKDSLVFGGNFIHSYNILQQLRVSEMEDRTRVPQKFRYPFYTEVLWYVLAQYLRCLTGKSYLTLPGKGDKNGTVKTENGVGEENSPKSSKTAKTEEDEDKKLSNGLDSTPRPARGRRAGATPTKALENGETDDSPDTKAGIAKLENDGDPDTPTDKKWTHLTPFERDGLKKLADWLENLPPTKRMLPKDLTDAEKVIEDIKVLLKQHEGDDPKEAVTGNQVIYWPASFSKIVKPKAKPGTGKGGKLGKNAAGNRRRRTRCKKCPACVRDDCGECHFCKDMRKFGGPGRMKQSCISRQCMAPELPNTATCIICDRDDRNGGSQSESTGSSLMECGICWEIVHPSCLKEKFENLENEGAINEDLPNSWECPKCNSDTDPSNLKVRDTKGEKQDEEKSENGDSASSADDTENEDKPKKKLSKLEGKRVTSKISKISKLKSTTLSGKKGKLNKPILTSLKKKPVIPTKIKPQLSTTKKLLQKGDSPLGLKSPPVVTRSGRTVVAKRAPDEDDDMMVSPMKRYKKEEANTSPPTSGKGKGKKGQGSSPGATGRGQGLRTRVETPGSNQKKNQGKGKGGKAAVANNSSPNQTTPKSGVTDASVGTKSSEKVPAKTKSKKKAAAKVKETEEPPAKQVKTIPPKYVIRPAPLPPPGDMLEIDGGGKHPLPRLRWLEIFRYVHHTDLARCMSVCKLWNRWCIDKSLWRELDLSHKKIKQIHLVGIVRRQPTILNLNYAVIAPKQLTWLIERLPHLKHLSLAYCSWATLSALCTSTCPLLTYLDLSWASGLRDDCFTDLISHTTENRPGVRIGSRLHKTEELQMAGTDISDSSLALIPRHLTNLQKLDLSYCIKLTNQGIEYLTGEGTSTRYNLKELDLTGCNQLTGECLAFLANCPNLTRLKLKACHKISVEDCQGFTMTYAHRKLMLRDDFDKLIVCAEENVNSHLM